MREGGALPACTPITSPPGLQACSPSLSRRSGRSTDLAVPPFGASDAFPTSEVGLFLGFECKMVTRPAGASTSEAGSTTTSRARRGPSTTWSTGTAWCPASYDKQTSTRHLKGYLKKVSEVVAQRGDQDVQQWQVAAQEAAREVLGSFNDWALLTGESEDPEGMVALQGDRENGTPYIRLFKDGLETEAY
ncbi:hypothetical protein ACFV1L_30345 [Kitasatospora sp. NPDC059646]|uniref:hypothetical protein n=1 Tax=Kitasatospora sp. NPDC059646 TaxID=3346893 RepID=UPI0036BD471E